MTRKEGIYHLLLEVSSCDETAYKDTANQLLRFAGLLGVITPEEFDELYKRLQQSKTLPAFVRAAKRFLKADFTLSRYTDLWFRLRESWAKSKAEPVPQ